MTYNPYTTPHREAAALCGLTLHRWPHPAISNHVNKCELHDAGGNVVFAGARWPDSWQFMRQRYGLTMECELEVVE